MDNGPIGKAELKLYCLKFGVQSYEETKRKYRAAEYT